jgi:hypothetical protein
MTPKWLLCLALGVTLAGGACERTISVGAAGDASAATAAELCTSTGGTVTPASCCANGVASFPDTCAIGACGCPPASSVTIMTCSCPAGCFSPGVGCVAKASSDVSR